MNDTKIFRNFNLLFLVFAVLWPLIKAQYLGGIDGAGRMQQAFMLLAVLINGKNLFKVPGGIWIWGVWIIIAIVNTNTKGFHSDLISFQTWVVNQLIWPFVTMLVAYRVSIEDFNRTIYIMFFTFLIYVILGTIGMTASASYDVGIRLNNKLGNEFFNTSILLTLFASLMYHYGHIRKFVFFVVLALITYIIVISGERKGLVALFVMILGALYAMNTGKGGKSIVYMIIILTLATVSVNYAMNYTTFGDRMNNSMAESQFSDNLFLQLMGDRGIMYYDGWKMFLDNMWTGIGLTNFRWENDFFAGLPLHTEYMVQLCECGILGSLFFLIFYGCMIKDLRELWKRGTSKEQTVIILSSLAAIIVINLVTWTYDNTNYFAVFGLVYAYCQLKKHTIYSEIIQHD